MKTSKYIQTLSLILLIVFQLVSTNVFAQNEEFGWRLGAGVGMMSYYGDLSNNSIGKAFKNHYQFDKDMDLSYSVFIERRLTPGIGLQLSGSKGYLSESDRNRSETDPLFHRALNFRSEINEGNLSFIFKSDNDKILGNKAFIAPYLMLGAGVTQFKVFGDLKNGEDTFYDYSQAVVNDGTYETNITNIGSEKTDSYPTIVPHVNAGIGLRIRFLSHFSLHVQTDLRYVFSDYLDDVSNPGFRTSYNNETQAFAGQPNPQYTGKRGRDNNLNDIYAISSASLRISFGQKKETFLPPVFYAQSEIDKGTETIQLMPTELKVGAETIVVYDTIKVVEKGYTATYDDSGVGEAKALLDSLQQVQLNNQQLSAQLKQAQADFSQLQQSLMEAQNSQDTALLAQQGVLLNRMDSLQKSVTNLYIVSAGTDQKAAPQDSTATDAKYTAELKQLRGEIDRLRAEQLADKRPSLTPTATPTTTVKQPLSNMPAVTPMTTDKTAKTSASQTDNKNYQNLQTDMEGLKAQIALLTNAVNAQTLALSKQSVMMPPVAQPQVIIQQPATGGGTNTQLESSLSAINNQLYLLNSRITALEQRPPTTTVVTSPPSTPQSVIVQQPVSGTDQALLNTIEDLRRQLQTLNNKVSELDKKRDAPIPATIPPATVVTPPPTNTTAPVTNLPATNTRPEVTAAYKAEVDKVGSATIFFDVNSAVIKDSELTKLERVVDIIRRFPEARITINGYTDSTGSPEYNLKLSEKRANAVLDRLINGYRVNPTQVILNGFGDANAMPGASSYDRRVDLQWVK